MFDLLLVTSVLFSDAYILPYQKADLVACQATISSFSSSGAPRKPYFNAFRHNQQESSTSAKSTGQVAENYDGIFSKSQIAIGSL